MTTAHTNDSADHGKRARALARKITRLTGELASAREELLGLLGPNERVAVPGAGVFQKVPAGWRPDKAFTAWLTEHKLLAKVTEPRPVVSMRLVNEVAKRTPTLLSYVTLARSAAAAKFALRFKAEGEPEDGEENV